MHVDLASSSTLAGDSLLISLAMLLSIIGRRQHYLERGTKHGIKDTLPWRARLNNIVSDMRRKATVLRIDKCNATYTEYDMCVVL